MKILAVLISLLGLMFTVGCEDEHEHFHHRGPSGGAYEGNYPGGYGHGYYVPDNGGWHRDRD